jgi:PKD repeat protein
MAQQMYSQEQLIENKKMEEAFQKKFESQRSRAEAIAKEKGMSLRKELPNGTIIEFAGFDEKGKMLFDKTYNLGAGRTISTNKVWPGGTVGTSLTGAGMNNRLGIWDGGAVRTSHQEFQTRAVQVDGATALSDHATHVAGTMVAGGVTANAKGMSYEAPLRAYDWNNDDAEMTSAAGAGMLVSNHSYGTITGWDQQGTTWVWFGDPSISNTEDWKFGFYDNQARDWDQIAFNNPNYLICKAAGNDRGDYLSGSSWEYSDGTPGSGTPPGLDGGSTGFDCIPTYGNAKNVLTVGAVNKINNGWAQVSDVVMSSFSGWGPTDDGRIKPDVVAAGVSIYSCISTSNTAYDTYQGTSMATPNGSGSLLLVQQHYNNVKKTFMRSATLKGLAIHTADEAGNAGPDYKFGWGLLNTAKAVQLISDSSGSLILERTLNSGSTYSQGITTDGAKPLRITISWTDRPGTPVTASLDPSNRMLVNDLDIKLTRTSDNTIFQPYILNPASPNSVATTGDNIRDNVEQIYLATPQAGSYLLTVSHKSTLTGGSQAYSLIISGQIAQPKAMISALSREICTGQSVNFSDASAGSPSLRRWYFPGGTPSTATTANPSISYSQPGKYPVALFVSNNLGSDSVYQFAYITVGGQNLPFTETFESNSPSLPSWVVQNPNNDTTWRFANVTGTNPGNQAYCLPFYNMAGVGRLDQLTSPILSFRGHTNVRLTFNYAYTTDPNFPSSDSLRIFISTNCGLNFTRLATFGATGTNNFSTAPATVNFFSPANAAEWGDTGRIVINLSAYSNLNNIRIRFEGYNNQSNNLYLDNITLYGTPAKPVANFFASKRTACVNENIQFYDSTQNFPTSWQWTFTGANISSSNASSPGSISYAVPGTYAVKLRVSNASGIDSITKTSYITVLPNPNKPNIRNAGPLQLCKGDSSMILTDSTNNVSSFQWYRDGQLISGASNPTLFIKDSGNYTVRTINSNGCGTFSDALLMNVYSLPTTPTITSNLSNDVFCQGGTVILTSSSNTSNQWYKNNIVIAGETNKTLSTQDSGLYFVRVINGICSSKSNEKNIRMNPKPLTSVIIGEDSVTVGATHSYAVTGLTGSSFNWIIANGIAQSGLGTSNINVKWNSTINAASVKVQETSINGCKGDQQTLNITMFWPVGIADLNQNAIAEIFPNPVNQSLFIVLTHTISKQIKVTIRNAAGVQVLETEVVYNGKPLEIDLSNVSSGLYLIEISSGNELFRTKFIKE